MKRPVSVFIGFCCVLTGIAAIQIVTTSVSYFGKGDMLRLDPLIWVACAALMFTLNNILMRRSTLLPVLIGANAALFGLALFALIRTAPALTGFISYVVVVLCAILTAVVSHRYSAKTQTLNSQMMIFDAYLFLMAWQFLVLEGGLPGDDLPFLLVVLVLNFISNLALRSQEHNVGRALQAAPVTGVIFSAGLFAVVGTIVYLFVRHFASSTRYATEMVLSALLAGFRFVFRMIERFFEWLFSLFEFRDLELDFEMETAETIVTETIGEEVQMSPEILYIITAIIALAAIAGLVYVVYRFRKTRLHQKSAKPAATPQLIRRGRGAGRMKKRIKALLNGIIFTIKSFRYINTPPGTFVRLERWGKRRGNERQPGQTMREYLLSLSLALGRIADDLDIMYYGFGTGSLSKADCRRIRRDFFKSRRKQNGHSQV